MMQRIVLKMTETERQS